MSRRALLHGLGLPVLTALVLTSCGDGGNDLRAARTTGSPAAEDAVAADVDVAEGAAQVDCPLTAEQVAAVLGTRMAQRESGCSFEAADGSFAEVYYSAVSVDVFAADEPTAVDGVGDEAYLGPSDELYVLARRPGLLPPRARVPVRLGHRRRSRPGRACPPRRRQRLSRRNGEDPAGSPAGSS